MTISMHNSSIPLFAVMFENMLKWLDKAQAHAEAHGFDPKSFLDTKLAPDMVALLGQVQLAADTATTWVSRLTGKEIVMKEEDYNEVTLDDARELIRRTIAYLKSIDPSSMNGWEGREVVHPHRFGEYRTDSASYLHLVTANLFFHVTMVYALLRHGGVELGNAVY